MDITGLTDRHINDGGTSGQNLRKQQLILDVAVVEFGESTDFVEVPLGRLPLVVRQIRC